MYVASCEKQTILRVGFFKGCPKTVGVFMVGFLMIPGIMTY